MGVPAPDVRSGHRIPPGASLGVSTGTRILKGGAMKSSSLEKFLLSYKWLCSWSLEKKRNSFGIVAKHHSFRHLLANCKFFNPKRHWNFRGEGFVGHISRMCHSISFGWCEQHQGEPEALPEMQGSPAHPAHSRHEPTSGKHAGVG